MPLEVGDVARPSHLRDQDGVERALPEFDHAERALEARRELLA